MRLENIKLSNFKNYKNLELSFSHQVNCILGANGSGKTNLLDAIHYLSLTKSAFNPIDSQNIRHQQDFFMIKGRFILGEKKETALCNFKKGQKTVKVNDKAYEKISDHIGRFPVVIISPNDQDIIREGSEVRRKFFDSMISQIDPVYLSELMRYHHSLRQRNALLKDFAERNYFDRDLLTPYNKELAQSGDRIHNGRDLFCQTFIPALESNYARLTGRSEVTGLEYISEWDPGRMELVFAQNQSRDLTLQRTSTGVHRDDFNFLINGYPLKKFGSQGQQKSFVIALKLAKFEAIKMTKGFTPILLLDDVFDKLDDNRINKLMDIVAEGTVGQLFVTDARPERTLQVFERVNAEKMMITIENGRLKNQA